MEFSITRKHSDSRNSRYFSHCHDNARMLQIRLIVCHRIDDSISACDIPGGAPWIELKRISKQTREVALFFACSNMKRRLGRNRHCLPPELMEMVSDFLVDTSYICMANDAAMDHFARIPTGLSPFTEVRVAVLHMRNLAHVQLMPEHLASACVKTTTADGNPNLTLTFLTKDGTVAALYYKFRTAS